MMVTYFEKLTVTETDASTSGFLGERLDDCHVGRADLPRKYVPETQVAASRPRCFPAATGS